MIAQRVLIIQVLYHPPAELLLCSSELFIFSLTSLGFNKLHLTAYLLCVMLKEFEQYSEKLGGFPIHTLKQALLKRVSGTMSITVLCFTIYVRKQRHVINSLMMYLIEL